MSPSSWPSVFAAAAAAAKDDETRFLGSWSATERRLVEDVGFGEFFARAFAWARWLPDGVVALLSHPSVASYVFVGGALLRGAPCVMLNYSQPSDALAAALDASRALVVAHSPDLAAVAAAVATSLVDLTSAAPACNIKALDDGVVVSGEAVAVVMFTSGTTGAPKGVPITHAGSLWACRNKIAALGGVEKVRNGTLGFLPNFHVMGAINNFLFNALCRCPSYVLAEALSPTAAVLVEAARALEPDAIDTVPVILEALGREAAARPDKAREYLAPLARARIVACGGAPLGARAFAALLDVGVKVVPHYGQTECGGGFCLLGGRGRDLMRPAGVGAVLVDRDEDGRGELVVLDCGSASPGYLGFPPPEVPFSRRRATGDIFEIVDPDGPWLRHVCRRDDVIVLSTGELANPVPMEEAASAAIGYAAARVLVVGQGRPAPVMVIEEAYEDEEEEEEEEEANAARVVVRKEELASRAVAAANAVAPAYAKISSTRAIRVPSGSLPVAASKGTVKRAQLERELASRFDALDADFAKSQDATATTLPAHLPATRVREIVFQAARELVGSSVRPDEPLVGSAGLSSSGAVQLARALCAELDITLQPTFVFDYPTLDAITAFLTGDNYNSSSSSSREPPKTRKSGRFFAASSREAGVAARALRCPFHHHHHHHDGGNSSSLVELVAARMDAVTEVPIRRWDASVVALSGSSAAAVESARYGAFLPGADAFDSKVFRLKKIEVEAMDPQQRVLLEVGYEALRATGATRASLSDANVGTFTGIMNYDSKEVPRDLDAYVMMGSGASALGARLSHTFALRGPCLVFDTACSSALVAAHVARSSLANQECDRALVAAPNLLLLPGFQHLGTAIMGMLSPRGRCHTLDDRADGFVRGEAAAAVVFSSSAKNCDVACANSATAHNGRSASFTALNGASQTTLIRAALNGADGKEIALLEAHGTGTALGDPVEISGATAAFCPGRRRRPAPFHVSAVKANLAHGEAAAGLVGLLAACCATPQPNAHLRRLNPQIKLVVATDPLAFAPPLEPCETTRATWRRRKVATSSFGWSGIISHAICEASQRFASDDGRVSLYRASALVPRIVISRNQICSSEAPPKLFFDGDGPPPVSLYRARALVPRLGGRPHPRRILGRLMPGPDVVAETRVAAALLATLEHHVIAGETLLPAVASTELVFSAILAASSSSSSSSNANYGSRSLALADVAFARPCVLSRDDDDAPILTVRISQEGNFQVTSSTVSTPIVLGRVDDSSRRPPPPPPTTKPVLLARAAVAAAKKHFLRHPPRAALTTTTTDVVVFVPATVKSVALDLDGGEPRRCRTVARESAATDQLVDAALGSTLLAFNSLRTRSIAAKSPRAEDVSFWVPTLRARSRFNHHQPPKGVLLAVEGPPDPTSELPSPNGMFDARIHVYRDHARASWSSLDHHRLVLQNANGPETPGTARRRVVGEEDVELVPAPPENQNQSIIQGGGGGGGGAFVVVASGSSALTLAAAQQLASAADRVVVECDASRSNSNSLAAAASLETLSRAANVYCVVGRCAGPLPFPAERLVLLESATKNRRLDDGRCCAARVTFSPWLLQTKSDARLRGEPQIIVATNLPPTKLDATALLSRHSLHAVLCAISSPRIAPSVVARPAAVFRPTERIVVPRESNDEEIITSVRRIATSLAGVEVDADSPLMEKGIDSLGATELSRRLAKHFGGGGGGDSLDVPATLLFDYPTPAQIAIFLKDRLAPRDDTDELPSRPRIEPPRSGGGERDVRVSAVGCRLPATTRLDDLREFTSHGIDTGTTIPISRWDVHHNTAALKSGSANWQRASYGSFVDGAWDMDAQHFRMSPAEAKALDPQQRLVLEVGYAMLHHVGMDRKKLAGSKTGVFLGMMNNDALERLPRGLRELGAFDVTGNGYATAAARLPYVFALHGPCSAVDTACSSTLVAAHAARQAILSDDAVDAVVLGPNLMLQQGVATVGGAVAGMFSLLGRCHTLDARADGYLRAEACGGVLLSSFLATTVPENDAGLLVPSIGVRHNGRAASFTALNGRSQLDLCNSVISASSSGRRRADVGFLEMHGTGTALGDPVEVGAASQVYYDNARHDSSSSSSFGVALAAVKANVGHTESSAGVAGLMKALVLLASNDVGRNAQLRIINPQVENVRAASSMWCSVEPAPRSRRQNTCGVNSFGFSGIISHAMVQRRKKELPPRLDVTSSQAPSLYRRKQTQLSAITATIAKLQRREPRQRAANNHHHHHHQEVVYRLRGDDAYLVDHRIDGEPVFPVAGHLNTIWMALSGATKRLDLSNFSVSRRAINLDGLDELVFTVAFDDDDDDDDDFCNSPVVVEHDGEEVARANVVADQLLPEQHENVVVDRVPVDEADHPVNGLELYRYLRRYGYEYCDAFRLIKMRSIPAANSNYVCEQWAQIASTTRLVAYLDSLLQVALSDPGSLRVATEIGQVQLRPSIVEDMAEGHHQRVLVSGHLLSVATSSATFRGITTAAVEKKVPAAEVVESDVHILQPLKTLVDLPPDEHARDMARHYAANAIARYIEARPGLVEEKPWMLKVAKAASVHRATLVPAVDKELYASSLYYRLHVDLYGDIPALVDRPFWTISNHPEHDNFYEANYDMYQLGVLLGVVVEDHFGHQLRIRELGAGSCGLTRRILSLIDPNVEEYAATDVSAIRPGVLEGHPKLRRRRYDVNDPIADDERGKYHLVVADNVIHVGSDMITCVRHVCDSLVDGGYIFLEECVTDAPLYLWGLDAFVWETATDDRSFGIWLARDEWTRLVDAVPELELVTSFESKHNVRLLFRYTRDKRRPPSQVVKTSADVDASKRQVFCDDGAFGVVKTLLRDANARARGLSALVSDDDDHNEGVVVAVPHRFTMVRDGRPHAVVSVPLRHVLANPSWNHVDEQQHTDDDDRYVGTHVVVGRCDGMALELVGWLFDRGATKVIVASIRADMATPWQRFRLEQHSSLSSAQKNSLEVDASTDISNLGQTQALLDRCGDALRGIWYAAPAAGSDPRVDNIKSEGSESDGSPDVKGIKNLDLCCRGRSCLDSFVVVLSSRLLESAAPTAGKLMTMESRLAVLWGPVGGIDDLSSSNYSVDDSGSAMNVDECLATLGNLVQVFGGGTARKRQTGLLTGLEELVLPVFGGGSDDDHAESRRMAVSINATGVITCRKQRQKVIETAPSSSATTASIREEVRAVITDSLGLDLGLTDQVLGAGVDSLMATQLVRELSHKFDVELPATFLFDHPTALEISTYIRGVATDGDLAPNDDQEQAVVSNPSSGSSPRVMSRRVAQSSHAIEALSFALPGGGHHASLSHLAAELGSSMVSNGHFPSSRWHPTEYDTRSPATTYGSFLLDGFTGVDLGAWRMTAVEASSLHPVQLAVLEHSTVAMMTLGRERVDEDGRVGVFVGGVGSLSSTFNRVENKRSDVFMLASNALAIVAGRVSFVLGLTGPCMSIDTACSSSLVALHTAMRSTNAGECTSALAASANAVEAEASLVLSNAGVLSPLGRCHTFDARADGYGRAEGAMVLVINPDDGAGAARGDRAVLIGPSRVLQDGTSLSLTAPNGSSQRVLLREVAAIADTRGGDLRLEAHGTGTVLGDPIEVGGAVNILADVFQFKTKCSSLKANIGHAEPTAGGAGLVAMLASLRYNSVPANVQLRRLNAHLSSLVRGKATTSKTASSFIAPTDEVGAATTDGRVSSFGFSGTLAHVRLVVPLPDASVPPSSPRSGTSRSGSISLLRNLTSLRRRALRGLASAQALFVGAAISNRKRSSMKMADAPPSSSSTSSKSLLHQQQHRNRGEMLDLVKKAADEAVGADVPKDEALLSAVGFDSMAVALVADAIADSIDVELPSTAFFDFPTIESLADYLSGTRSDDFDIPMALVSKKTSSHAPRGETIASFLLESMSLVLPGHATSLDDVGEMAARALDALGPVPLSRWDASDAATPAALYGGFFLEVPPTPDGEMWRMPPAEVRSADPKQLLALTNSFAALEASSTGSVGAAAAAPGAERTAVMVGTVGVVCPDVEATGSRGKAEPRGAYASTGGSLAVTAGRISFALGLQGPCAALDTACSTALVCLHFATHALSNGECDRAVSTAVAWLEEGNHRVISNAGMLSPQGKCFTLDSRASGYARGEGCVALVMSQASSKATGAATARYAVGPTAVQQDGASASLTAPNGRSQRRLLTTVALQAHSAKMPRVSVLEGHGTGTALGDPIEVGSARAALQACNVRARYQSFKANVGHLEPTAGAAGIVNVLAGLSASAAAPNARLRTLNPHLNSYLNNGRVFAANVGDPTPAAPVLQDGRVSSFGFSGTIAHTYHTVQRGTVTRDEKSPYVVVVVSRAPSLFRKSAPFSAHSHLRGIATWQHLWAGLLENEAQKKLAAKATTRGGGDARATAVRNEDVDAEAVINAVVTESFGREVSPDEPLMALGLDSLAMGDMGAMLVERLDTLLPATLLFDYPTVNDVVAYVQTECGFGSKEQTSSSFSSDPFVVTPPPPPPPPPHCDPTRDAPPALTSACFDLPGRAGTPVQLGNILARGLSTVSTVPVARWDSSAFEQVAGPSSTYGSFTDYQVNLDNACFKMSPLEAAANDPQQLRLLEVSYAALHAGAPGVREKGRSALARQDYGVFAGAMGVTGRDDDISYVPEKPVEKISALGIALSVMSGRVSFALGLTGPCLALDTACSTTLVTLHLASSAVANRECSRAVSAGTILLREVANVVGAIAGMLSNHGRCFTFDSRADGYARGEGTVACVVVAAAAAAAEGERSIARVAGTAVRQDGPSANLSAPNGSSQRKLLRAVVERPVNAAEIVVEAHGTGTMLGDPIEMGGVHDVIAAGRRRAQVGSLKGFMGHLETSAGAAGLSSLLVALADRCDAVGFSVFANPQLRSLNSHLFTLLDAANKPTTMPVDASAVAASSGRINSFGFSGTIAHALVVDDRRYERFDAGFRPATSADYSLFRAATPHKPFRKPELVSIQAAVASGDRAIYDELRSAGPSSAPANRSKGASRSSAIVDRRAEVRVTLENIFSNDMMLDMSTSAMTDIDSIAMTQLVSSINDAFAIESEIGEFVALDDLNQAIEIVERRIAAKPLDNDDDDDDEDDEDTTMSQSDRKPRISKRFFSSVASVCVEHWGSSSEVVVFVHDETGSCVYVRQALDSLTFARARVITIQAPEVGDCPTARNLDVQGRARLYAEGLRKMLPEPPCALTVVGCGATIGIARRLAAAASAVQLVFVNPCPAGIVSTRGSIAFAKRFYQDYCGTMLDDLAKDPERVAALRKSIAGARDLSKLRAALRQHVERATLDDLEKLCEITFHTNAVGSFGGADDKSPDDDDDDDDDDAIVVWTRRGADLLAAGWYLGDSSCFSSPRGDDLPDTTLDSATIRDALGIEVEKERRTFAYVPFVNTVDVEDCLKCWKPPAEGAPSVIFVHGGIGVVGIAANYARKLGPGVGLFAVQAPEHQDGNYDWAPTPSQRADRYLRVLMAHVPNGGVCVGYSFAGNIVFEIALMCQEQRRHGEAAYPFEFFLLEPVPPTVPTRTEGESLLEHHARFVDKIMAEELFPAVFNIDGPIRLDAMARVRSGTIRTVSELLAFTIDRVDLDPRFAIDFERMMEFIYNLKLAPPSGVYRGDVHYLMIVPDGWRHYDLYWSYRGSLEEPWRAFIDGDLHVHKTIKGNHFQAFDTDENMEAVKIVIDPLLDKVHEQQAIRSRAT
ncbi:hypothetical protein CTAYLR_007317 [Chrysophaeum taylorii]|uniref:Uncharacterized protein n=1 Tax=Chrysophaeum taylorii TaxID=2483200 RepID=A0AAD7XHF8_9STRA|nr:hypothetical protein CTAYLR_007317 [Chrysophaeum taylorii]